MSQRNESFSIYNSPGTNKYVYIYMYIYMYIYTYICDIYTCTYTHTHTYISIYICIYIYIYIYTYIYMYMYIHIFKMYTIHMNYAYHTEISHVPYTRVLLRIYMYIYTPSRVLYITVMSRVRKRQGTRESFMSHMWIIHVSHVNHSCLTCE